MNHVTDKLSELKLSLENLESAVQQPSDERISVEQVLESFPSVLTTLSGVLQQVLLSCGIKSQKSREVFTEAHRLGWLKGELSLWLRLVSDYQQIKEEETHGARARSIAQDIRACSCILWETYEMLLVKFRYQTQVRPAALSSRVAESQAAYIV